MYVHIILCRYVIRPGVRRPVTPGFLKLLLCGHLYVWMCMCVCVCPRGY